ncbi:MAG: Tad domain-containing protein, partial [Gemmataceae bacterium]|nr:Tad domain-containing protein [Gemmataceae bacterium]
MRPARRPTRPGSALPLLFVTVVGLFSFTALAVDLGLVAVSRTQCQNAADIAALVACRNLDNKRPDDPTYDSNRPAAVAAAAAAAAASPLMSGTVPTTATNPAVRAGVYAYDTATQRFAVSYPATPGAGRSWTAIEVALTAAQPTYFMKLWGVTGMPTGARAVAVHRPRDTAFVLDMTGSMAFSSTFNFNNQSLNPDPLVPAFGHYTSVQPKLIAAANQTNSSGEAISRNNFTITTPGGPPIARNFSFVIDAANQADPAAPAYPLPADRSVVRNAFHRWSPPETAGDPTNYVSQTYDFAGYNAYHTGAEADPKGPTPAPDTFKTMTDAGGITYVGDRWRRADGGINKTNTSWATGSAATKAAGTAIELLGYNVSGSNVRGGTSGGSTITTEDKFRDPTWEAYGYDLDIPKYRTWKGTGAPADPVAYVAAKGGVDNILVPAADRFQGFSMGPGYWGKTFYVWPPDPRAPVGNPGDAGYVPGDWRRRYFNRVGVATAVRTSGGTTVTNVSAGAMDPQQDNNPYNSGANTSDGVNEVLLGSSQTLAAGTSSQSIVTTDLRTVPPTVSSVSQTVQNYQVNYPAVLRWLKSGPQVLPPNLRAGRVLYYSSIPSDVDTATGDAQQKLDKLFWKNYIDYVLGVTPYTSAAYLYGAGDSWSGASRSIYTSDLATWTGPAGLWPAARPYMRYNDSPQRPRLHSWFGPLSLMDFLGNQSNWNPGTCHEAQCWQLKAGMNSVLDDIRNNHPNDSVGM